jgi:hypothetical protein
VRRARFRHGGRLAAVVLAIVLGVLIAADAVVRAIAEHAVAAELASSLGMSHRPEVSLGGFPFLIHALSGDLPSASFDAGQLEVEGLSFDRVRVSLTGVRVPTGQLLSSQGGTITARDGTGSATMSGSAVSSALHQHGAPVTVTLSGQEARLSDDGLPGEVRAKLSIGNGELVVKPGNEAIPVSFSLDLPELLPGMRYTSVQVEGSRLVLSFDLTDARFDIP